MHALEYICKFHGLKYTDLAEELGIKTQNITSWVTKLRKIPKKQLKILSEKFKIAEKYLVIEDLTELQSLNIEKILLENEIDKSTVKFGVDAFYDRHLPVEIRDTDDNIEKAELIVIIKKQMEDSEEEYRSLNEENVKLYKMFSNLMINSNVNKKILINVLQAVELASTNSYNDDIETDTDIFRVGLAKTIKKYDEIKKKQKEEFDKLSKELFDTEQ
ncbi:helix-turn-helix domain-containing protein [Clostridium estertheticum]|uniref:helix-turn-helix domain-containing protein n=1 Tax=Clostridium estertheticum TaxID=238834 RepID=UPI001C7E1AE8|nr:helix-turn-helix transcriptional regulator [Clostridium estertheticum]MBX4258833.1 helix-turn-helix domain-containing protein [Clostridium estertheticum]WLC69161.1 helix-turn-helix domain-containing protein [Clostridium estertheticum]